MDLKILISLLLIGFSVAIAICIYVIGWYALTGGKLDE